MSEKIGDANLAYIDRSPVKEELQAYIECAFWTSESEGEHWTIGMLAPEALEQMEKDIMRFLKHETVMVLMGQYPLHAEKLTSRQIGHDIWLTRNGHGTGFWDRNLPDDLGKGLADVCHILGECDLYKGDDERLYLT